MKLSVAVAGQSALPSAFVVFRGFETSMRKAALLGYQGIELALKSADEINATSLRAWLAETGLAVSAITTGQVFADAGLYFTHARRDVRRQAVDVFAGLIRLAAEFGGLVNIGRARGFVAQGQTRDEAMALFADVMHELCAIAQPYGVQLIIEPVNRYETNFLNNLDEAAEAVRLIGCANLGLMPDVFHMNIEDADIGGSLRKHAELIRYIHLADSNRLAPGQGHLRFDEVFEALQGGGFDGWASVEIQPVPDADTAARQAAETLLPLIGAYNRRKAFYEVNG